MMNRDEILLPTRDFLRQLMGHTMVKEASVKKILRGRGIFSGSGAKEVTAPLLIKTGISPSEYTNLQDSYRTREETPKYKTWQILSQGEMDLNDALPINQAWDNLLHDKFGAVVLSSIDDFTMVDDDPSHVQIGFSIERNDALKNMGSGKMKFSGKVEFKKNGNILNVVLTHSSDETKFFAEKIANATIKHFKSVEFISNEQVILKIEYSDFDNESRVKFLNDLTRVSGSRNLKFVDTADIQFSSDASLDDHPEKISWMKDRIDNLKIKGKDLHNTFFVSDTELHPFLKIYTMQCNYDFEIYGAIGRCRLAFEFSDEDAIKDNDLVINISSFNIIENNSDLSKAQVKRKIIDEINMLKVKAFTENKRSD